MKVNKSIPKVIRFMKIEVGSSSKQRPRLRRGLLQLPTAACIMLFFIIHSSFLILPSFSQNHTFKSSKIKINNYGTREQTSTITPNIISINLSDSIIIVQPEHPGINEFLGHQNQFAISKSFGSGNTTRVYFTSSEYVFTIDSKLRVIVVSKRDISPKIHSVWFEEISSSN